MSSDQPVGGRTANKHIKKIFRGEIGAKEVGLKDDFGAYDGPYGVIDPRLIGYSYLSYMFIESGNNLSSGFENRQETFQDDKKALMIGATLGEYDFISRRADVDQFRHAQFAVDAIDDQKKSFIKNIETYPIFSVGRWHGQDINIEDMTMQMDVEKLNLARMEDIECELLYQMNRNPASDPDEWVQNIRERAERGVSLVSQRKIENKIDDNGGIKNICNAIEKKYILGDSIGIDPANLSGYYHLIVGISVKEGVEIEDDEEYNLPNEKIMDSISNKDVFDGWTMPYIVSGVGKSWGDILVEIHTDNIDDMETYAEILREEVDGVRSTKTFALTGTSFHKPLVLESPKDIRTRN